MKKQLLMVTASIGILFSGFYSPASAQEVNYKVQSGDTLWKIATSNNISVQDLQTWNHLNSTTIYVGQELSLIAPNSNTTYTVKSGDSLYFIAKAHNTTVTQLKSINQLTSDLIYIGQVLKLTPDNEKTASKNTLNVDALIAEGKKYIGVPYVWGGSTPSGFDCSGFLNYVFGQVGVSIPRTVEKIWSEATPVSTPKPGDLVFFTTYKEGPSHAGLFIGDDKFLQVGTSTGVTITDMNNPYWKARYLGAKKVNL